MLRSLSGTPWWPAFICGSLIGSTVVIVVFLSQNVQRPPSPSPSVLHAIHDQYNDFQQVLGSLLDTNRVLRKQLGRTRHEAVTAANTRTGGLKHLLKELLLIQRNNASTLFLDDRRLPSSLFLPSSPLWDSLNGMLTLRLTPEVDRDTPLPSGIETPKASSVRLSSLSAAIEAVTHSQLQREAEACGAALSNMEEKQLQHVHVTQQLLLASSRAGIRGAAATAKASSAMAGQEDNQTEMAISSLSFLFPSPNLPPWTGLLDLPTLNRLAEQATNDSHHLSSTLHLLSASLSAATKTVVSVCPATPETLDPEHTPNPPTHAGVEAGAGPAVCQLAGLATLLRVPTTPQTGNGASRDRKSSDSDNGSVAAAPSASHGTSVHGVSGIGRPEGESLSSNSSRSNGSSDSSGSTSSGSRGVGSNRSSSSSNSASTGRWHPVPVAPSALWRHYPSTPSPSLLPSSSPPPSHNPLTTDPIQSLSFLLYSPQGFDPLPVFRQLLLCSSHHPLLSLETIMCLEGPTVPPVPLQATFPSSSSSSSSSSPYPSTLTLHVPENATQTEDNRTHDQQTNLQDQINYHRHVWLSAFEEQRTRTAGIAASLLAELAGTENSASSSPAPSPSSSSSSSPPSGFTPKHRLHLLQPPKHLGAPRAFNTMAAISASELVITLGPAQLPPSGCQCAWLKNFTGVFAAWPRLGAAGIGTGKIGLQPSKAAPLLDQDRLSTEQFFNRMRCPVTGTRFSFVLSVVKGAMAMRREAFLEVGGFSDVDGAMDELSEADLCRFLWLSGYQVALMYQESECRFESIEPWASRTHSMLSERLDMVHSSLTDRIVAEVKRSNRLLKPLKIWE